MIRKVYVCKDIEIALLQAKEEFTDLEIWHCSDLSETDLLKILQPSLFKNSCVKCFVGIDCAFSSEFLLNLASSSFVNSIWIFKTLAKNTKLYKKLDSITTIEFYNKLEKTSDKKRFIQEKASDLPKNIISKLIDRGSDNQSVLVEEIKKLKDGLEILTPEELDSCIVEYESSNDIFNFLEYTLTGNMEKAYLYAHRVSKSLNSLAVSALIQKKIISMIYLSLNDVKAAYKYWRYPQYLLQKEQTTSKKIGFQGLIRIYLFVDVEFNKLNTKPLLLRLGNLIYFVGSKEYENNNHRFEAI